MRIIGRPVLLGMNNPLSEDPKHALAPYPERSAGHRLWTMLNEVSGVGRSEYMAAFDRRNLVEAKFWYPEDARKHAPALLAGLAGREVVVLGHSVRNSLQLYALELGGPLVAHGVLWRFLLHPSGRTIAYNQHETRLCAGLLLEELYHRGVQASDT